MTLPQIVLFVEACQKMDALQLRSDSIAARAGMADDESFKQHIRSLE